MIERLSDLADKLVPLLLDRLSGNFTAIATASGSGLATHGLSSAWHTGTLDRAQAPWVATDIAAHAALPDVHHARVHDIVGGDHTITGAALSLVGAPSANTLGLISPSANPGTTEAVLKSTGGLLTLPNFTATTKVTTPHAGGPTTFTSGFTGAGYRLDDSIATAGKTTLELDEMIVRGRMRVYELLIHQIRATNGSVFVTGVGKAKTVTGTGPYTIATETDHGFAANDLIRAQRFTGSGVYQCNMQVTSVATTLQFTATLSSGDAPAAGMEFVRLGNTTDTTRQGSIYLTADDTFAPAIDILDGVSSFAEWGAASKIKVRLGKLTSSLDANLLPSGYGLYAPNAYLSGDFLTGGGTIRMYNASGINIAQDTWGSWDNKRALQWWPDVATMTGSPSFSIYTGRAVGGFTDNQNFSYIDANPTGGQLAGLSLTAFGQGTGASATIYLEGGSQALTTSASVTVTAANIDLVGGILLDGTTGARQMNPQSDMGYSLGSAILRWNTLYVNQIIAGTISGASMSGATWSYPGNMVIDATSAGGTTVSVVNSGAGVATLAVDGGGTFGGTLAVTGGITSGGTAVSLAGHTHSEYLATTGATTGATSQAQAFTNGVLLNNGSSATPALAFSSDTTNGIYRISAGVMGIPKALTVGWLKNSLMGFSTQGTADLGMMGFYDRSELINANLRGTVTITFTGAGSVTSNTVNNAFNSRGGFLSITGTDATTTQIVIHIDLGATQPNYSAALWQPFLQYRDAWSLTSRSKYKGIVCEVSSDNSTWYKPAGGEWETTDASAAETVPGLWMGTNASPSIPGNVWRYVRFTLTTRQAGASFADQVSISQIGLRHYAAPYSRAWLYTSGDTMYGALVIKTGSTAALDVQTAAGVAVFTVNTTAATATLAGDLTVDDLAIGNGLVSAPALTFASDADSGIYRSTANTWHLVANGATVQTVTTAGISVVGALTVPTINTASGTLTLAPANSTTAVTGVLSLTGTLSGASWNVTSGGAATLVTVSASTSVTTPSITTASGNLALTSVGGTVAVTGALTGTSTATFATSVVAPLHTAASGNLTVSAPATLLLNAATANTVDLQINSVSQWSASDSRLNPRGSVLVDIGDYNRKVRTLFAAELYVETLVAQNVLATIGGRVMVAPTTKLIADLSTSAPIPLWTNLTSWWTLDEASGNRSDSKGSNTLTDTNTVMSVGGKKSAAGMFVKANSERLTIADNASLSVGDIDFYIAAWVYPTLDDGASQHTIAAKAAGSGNRAWYLYIDWSANQAKFRVFDSTDASTTVTASTFGNLSINTWYFVEAWHDSVNNQITISINGTSTTASHTTGSRDDSGAFQLGAANGSSHFDGYIDEALFAKYIPTATERAWLYNAGTGRSYSEVGSAQIIDVEHNQWTVGDYIYMQTAPGGVAQIEAMQVVNGPLTITGGYRYWAYRNLDGTGTNTWVTGDAVVNLGGAAGEGYLELTATSTIHNHLGPTTTYYVRTGTAAWNDVKPVVTQGNLRSFVDYTGDEFGTAAGNDLTLTPATGYKGYTLDRVNGLRLFNVDFRLYESATKRMEIIPSAGLNLLADNSITNQRQMINWYRDLDSKSAVSAAMLFCYTSGVTNNINFLVNRDGANYGASMKLGTPTSYVELTEVNSTTSTGTLYASNWTVVGNLGVGIGPAFKLDVNGNTRIAAGSSLYMGDQTDAGNTGLRLVVSGGQSYIDSCDGDIIIRADNVNGATERMRIANSTGAVTFANSVGTDWTNLSYASGWGDYGGSFTPGQYKKVGDLVFLRGLVARSSGASLNIATLPSGYRPQYRYLFGVHTSSGGGGDRVDILTSGNIDLQVGGVTYVQLDGLVFSTYN